MEKVLWLIPWLKVIGGMIFVLALFGTMLFLIARRKRTGPTATGPTPPGAPATPEATPAPAPATKKKGFGWGWLMSIIFVSTLTWWITSYNTQAKLEEVRQQQTSKSMGVRYEWYWKLPAGVTAYGRNENPENERVAEGISQKDPNVIRAEVYYTEYGTPETERIRIQRVGSGKSWQGTRDQDNPEDHCRLDLLEVSPGMYSGDIIWKDGKIGKCYLKIIQ